MFPSSLVMMMMLTGFELSFGRSVFLKCYELLNCLNGF